MAVFQVYEQNMLEKYLHTLHYNKHFLITEYLENNIVALHLLHKPFNHKNIYIHERNIVGEKIHLIEGTV